MSRRFIIGALCVALINASISTVFLLRHGLMQSQPSWFYVFEFAEWWVWCSWFAVSSACLTIAVSLHRDVLARAGAVVSVMGLTGWTAALLLVPLDSQSQAVTGMVPLLTGALAALEMVFLALPARDWFDDIRRRDLTGDLSQRGR